MQSRMTRRGILRGGLVVAGGVLGWRGRRATAAQSATTDAPGKAAGGGAARVNEKDSLAVALGYVSDVAHIDAKANPTYQAGATCSNCSWYQGKGGDPTGGPCTFFPGKLVEPHAWCRMWNKRQ